MSFRSRPRRSRLLVAIVALMAAGLVSGARGAAPAPVHNGGVAEIVPPMSGTFQPWS